MCSSADSIVHQCVGLINNAGLGRLESRMNHIGTPSHNLSRLFSVCARGRLSGAEFERGNWRLATFGKERKAARYSMYSLWISAALVLGSTTFVSAQQGPFVEPAKNSDLTPQQNHMLLAIMKTPSTEDVQVVHVYPSVLKNSDRVSIPLKAHSVSIQNSSREFRGDSIVSWIGKAPDEVDGSTSMAVNGDNVTASIQTMDGLYRIRPLGDGLHALIKVNLGKFPTEHPPSFNEKNR